MRAGSVSRRLVCIFSFFAIWLLDPTSSDGAEFLQVDLELVLAVDVSPSMNDAERTLQRNGYISAFRHPEVLSAIRSGPLGRIAVTYVEWAGPRYQVVTIPWTVLAGVHDTQRFADELAQAQPTSDPGTSISGGLFLALRLIQSSPVRGLRRVIDVSGDGINNSGPPIAAIREHLISLGIVINGLPITLPTKGSADDFRRYDGAQLTSYYEHCVIGGPGAFLIAVEDLNNIASAIQRKLVREIAASRPRVIPAAFLPKTQKFDCLGRSDQPGR